MNDFYSQIVDGDLIWRGKKSNSSVGKLEVVKDGNDGWLYIAEAKKKIPFDIKRVYFIDNLRPQSIRGLHAHKKLKQWIYAVRGKFRLTVYDGKKEKEIWLDKPSSGFYLAPMLWHMMDKFSKDCLICVFASDYYDEKDYVRDFSEFKRLVK